MKSLLVPVALVLLLVGLFTGPGPAAAQDGLAAITVPAEGLAEAVGRANPGDTIHVTPGIYNGSLVVDKPLELLGDGWPILDGGGQDTVLKLVAPGITVRGFVIRNSGASLDEENAGIAVEASDATIVNNRFEETLFGIYLRQANNSLIRGNAISSKDLEVPRRGDPIRVWSSNDVRIESNRINKGRDVVLWYSERITVRYNDVSDGRYGLHFMYCDDALIEHNRLLNNSVGAFLMYSRRLTMHHNTVANNRGPSGYGIGLKDMDDAVVVENLFLDNRVGAYVDGSPREVDSIGRFEGNVFAYNDIGVSMLPSVRHNQFQANSFVDNQEQVGVAGGGQLRENEWTVGGTGNFWSDYAGYDADADGSGDVVYRSDRLFEDLLARKPALRLFLYSPATEALDFAARAFPVVKPQPKLVDERPLMAPRVPVDAPPLPAGQPRPWPLLAALLVLASLALARWPHFGGRRHRFSTPVEKTS